MSLKYLFNPFSGKFDLVDVAAPGVSATPTRVVTPFFVAADTQMLYDEEIDADDEIELDGLLTEVN